MQSVPSPALTSARTATEAAPGTLERWLLGTGLGRRWAIDDYHGETARLEIGPLPGIGRRFLVAHILSGAYQFRLVVFEVHEDGSLTLCASGWTIAEGAQNEYLFEIAFGDVDGQDVFLESHRRWLFDDGGGIIAGWAVCTVAHAWTGSRFEPRWLYLWGADEESPWVPIDPPDEAGIERAEKAATALILAALHR